MLAPGSCCTCRCVSLQLKTSGSWLISSQPVVSGRSYTQLLMRSAVFHRSLQPSRRQQGVWVLIAGSTHSYEYNPDLLRSQNVLLEGGNQDHDEPGAGHPRLTNFESYHKVLVSLTYRLVHAELWWGHAELWWRTGLQKGSCPPLGWGMCCSGCMWLHPASLLQPGLADGRLPLPQAGGCTPVKGSACGDPMQRC